MSMPLSLDSINRVWDCWEFHAKERPQSEAILHWDELGEPFRWTYGALIEASHKIALRLLEQKVKPGDVCALIMRHHPYFYPVYLGIASMGAIPAVLAYPNARLHPDKFLHGLSGMAKSSGLDWILTEKDLEPVLRPILSNGENAIQGILFPLDDIPFLEKIKPAADFLRKTRTRGEVSRPFLLQHSSGTTGLQKAVVLSHQAVLRHLERYSESIQLTQRDRIISWLPLYHDMGLIAAFHMPLALGVPSIQLDPFQWLSAPGIFFQAVSKEKATLAWLPNFSYPFMAEKISDEDLSGVDLSSLRMLINCSEVVRSDAHEKFLSRFQKYGLRKNSLAACYALAETTFAVTQTPPGCETACVEADRAALAEGRIVPAQNEAARKICVSSGPPIRGCSIKILDDDGAVLPEGRVGSIAIQSDSLFEGYRNQEEKTRQVLKDGWYYSGDRGFLWEKNYYILGRKDDVIVAAGKNIFPEDVEDAVNQVEHILPGRVAAVGLENEEKGTQDVWVIAETGLQDKGKLGALALAVKQAGMNIDVTIAKVCLVPPRWLIKSSSGKISRKANRERVLSIASKEKMSDDFRTAEEGHSQRITTCQF